MPKHKIKEEDEEVASNEGSDAGSEPPVDAGETSICFSRRRLPDVLRFGSRADHLAFITVSRHFATVAQGLEEHRALFGARLLSAFEPAVPRWIYDRAQDDPRVAIVDMCRECKRLGAREVADRRVLLQLPATVVYNIEGWANDVFTAADELGQSCFMRWDLIDQVRNPEEIVYTFKFVAGNLYFTAENKAASRIGVTSSFCKMWLKMDVPGVPVQETKTAGDDGDGEHEGKKKGLHLKTIAVIEGDAFDAYCSWRKKTEDQRNKQYFPAGTFDGSIEFACLPGVGPAGNAPVKFRRV